MKSNKIDPVTLAMNKYTSELSFTDEDIHWLSKRSSKRLMEIKNMAEGAVTALHINIDLDASKLLHLGHGTKMLSPLCVEA